MNADQPHSEVAAEKVIPTDLPRPGARTIILVVVLFLLMLAGMFVVGYVPHRGEAARARADADERASAVPVVGVATPRENTFAKDIVLPADIRPYQETAIYPRTSGYLKKQYVDINDRVKAGELLAEIDTPEVDAQLIQSKAALDQAKANVAKAVSDIDLAAKTLARYKDLPPGAASAQDLDVHQSAYDAAVAALAQTKASVGVAEADVQRLTVLQGFEKVTAPFSGIVTARGYDVGALLSATSTTGREMFRITQSDRLRVDVYLPQVLTSEITMGEPATLEVRNYPQKQFKGVVSRSAGSLNANSRTMLLEVVFDNPDGLLYAGMYGQVHLAVSGRAPVLMVPTSAMAFNANGTQVMTVVDGKVHFQSVSVGRDFGTEMEVLSGLSKQTQVVSNPAAQLVEGMSVRTTQQGVAGAPGGSPRASR